MLAILHRPIVAVHIIVAGETTTIILHIVGMILTATIIAQCPTARVNLDLAALVVHYRRRVFHEEHFIHSTQEVKGQNAGAGFVCPCGASPCQPIKPAGRVGMGLAYSSP